MATLTVQDARQGLDQVTFAAATGGGDDIPAGTRTAGWGLTVALLVDNASAGAVTVTVANHPPVAVAAGGLGVIPVRQIYRGQLVGITYSAVASVTVAAVQMSG